MEYRFSKELAAWPAERVRETIASASPADVDRAIAADTRGVQELCALLSPHAQARLEPMARAAQKLTRWHFGRTIGLYVPLYTSNVCGADCVYCGYAVRSGSKQKRLNLTDDEVRRECEALAAHGFQSVLLLTGEAPKSVSVDDIARSVEIVVRLCAVEQLAHVPDYGTMQSCLLCELHIPWELPVAIHARNGRQCGHAVLAHIDHHVKRVLTIAPFIAVCAGTVVDIENRELTVPYILESEWVDSQIEWYDLALLGRTGHSDSASVSAGTIDPGSFFR